MEAMEAERAGEASGFGEFGSLGCLGGLRHLGPFRVWLPRLRPVYPRSLRSGLDAIGVAKKDNETKNSKTHTL